MYGHDHEQALLVDLTDTIYIDSCMNNLYECTLRIVKIIGQKPSKAILSLDWWDTLSYVIGTICLLQSDIFTGNYIVYKVKILLLKEIRKFPESSLAEILAFLKLYSLCEAYGKCIDPII